MPQCYPQADFFIPGAHPDGSSRSLSRPVPPGFPEFRCKIRRFRWPGQKHSASSQGQSFSQLPDDRVRKASRGPPARTLPGPSPPPRTLPSPREGPTCLPSPVPTPGSPCQLLPGGCTPPARSPLPCRGSTSRGGGARKGPPDRLTLRRPPEAGSREPVSVPGRGQAGG